MELDLHHNLAHSPPSPLLILSAVSCVSCFAYRAHTARLLQPRTLASAYGVAVVLDIAESLTQPSGSTEPLLIERSPNTDIPSLWLAVLRIIWTAISA